MNYRRGLQRVCLILVFLWLIFVFYGTPKERLMFWSQAMDLDGIASRYGGWREGSSDWQRFLQSLPYPDFGTRGSKLFWLIEVGIAPPAVLYLILFCIIPWIGRGFRSKDGNPE